MSGTYSHCAGGGGEYALERTVFGVVRTGNVCRHLTGRGERVDRPEGASVVEGAEGVEGPVCASEDKFVDALPKRGRRLRTFVDVRIV